MMEYKGYIGKVEMDDEADILHGEIINISDVITFEGTSVDEIQKAFRESVDDYLDFYTQRGESPEKPFSHTPEQLQEIIIKLCGALAGAPVIVEGE